MKIAVLGAFGQMGEAALHDLASSPRVAQVLAVDRDLGRAGRTLAGIPGRSKVRPVRLDLTRRSHARRALAGCDLLLNCAWYEFNLDCMRLALDLKAHYVDLGGLFHMTLRQLKLHKSFQRAGRLAILGCGSTPGITNMMVRAMADRFLRIRSVHIYDASFDPEVSRDFLPPFSIRTMLDELEMNCPTLAGGRLSFVKPLSLPEEVRFPAPIGQASARAIIHSELATLPGALKSKGVREMAFKIVYPKGVSEKLEFLVDMGLADSRPLGLNGSRVSPRDVLTAIASRKIQRAVPGTPSDYEVLRVVVSGRDRNRRPLGLQWDLEMRPTPRLTAGAIGVGFTASIASQMILRGQVLETRGVHPPERALEPDCFFKGLAARRVFKLKETHATSRTVPS